MHDTFPAAHVLSAEQRRSLRCLAEIIIPASAEYGVPGAGDELIFADILHSVGRDAEHVATALRGLDILSGGVFADLNPRQRKDAAERLHAEGGEPLMYTARIILQCYYRDDRVMRSLGMEVRPPFPKGFAIEQGNWSLLEPVRARAKMWRDVP
jgi:hypothetical protein